MFDALLLAISPGLPLAAALVQAILPLSTGARRAVSSAVGVVLTLAGIVLGLLSRNDPGFVLRESAVLFPEWGISWHVGVDGLAAAMLALSGLVQVCASLVAAPAERERLFHVLLQLLFVGVNGAFIALDAVFFYVFWEIMLVPMFLLVGIWGGAERRQAAVKFFLYTMAGSVALLLALLVLHASVPQEGILVQLRPAELRENLAVDRDGMATLHDLPVFVRGGVDSLRPLAASEVVGSDSLSAYVRVGRDFDLLHWKLLAPFWGSLAIGGISFPALLLLLLFVAFAVKIPVVPLHLWLPHAHVQAPTSISVVLAGILLKLGVFGLLRWAWPLFPIEVYDHAAWIAGLGALSIVWGGLAALGQNDLKRLVAYSSISHMGFCLLGLASVDPRGLAGAAFQCVAHGFSASLLFLLVGALYERAHHRRVDGFGGLAQVVPGLSGFFLFAAMAGAGLPGLAGFVGELSTLLGGWATPAIRWVALISATGVILSAGYLLWMVQRVLYGPLRHAEQRGFPDMTIREWAAILPPAFLTLALGIWPDLLQAVVGPFATSLSGHMAWVIGLR